MPLPQEGLQEQLAEIVATVHASLKQVENSIKESIETVARQFEEATRPLLEELPRATREVSGILGKYGWYLDPKFTLPKITPVAQQFERGEAEAAERVLADHYRARLPAIAADLVSWYPARTKVLTPAFNAHQRGEYVLSVPVFLAQVDGICDERLGASPFRKNRKNRRPETAEAIEQRQWDVVTDAFLHVLTISLPISASTNINPAHIENAQPNALNRHAVVHGISVDYGTELNSLKAISLLYYVAWVLRKHGNDKAHSEG